jgi:large subunit ribosomal protein L32
MAVQQTRKSHSKSRMRRAHDFLTGPSLSSDPMTGELHRRHHVTKEGYYRGKKVLENKALDVAGEE